MDWNSKRIRALLEAALIEDKAAHNITTVLTIGRTLRATTSVVPKEPCVIAGLGAINAS